MWDLFLQYKADIKNNPIRKQVFVGKDGHTDWEERERPLTMEGFENFVADLDIIEDLSQYFANTEGRYDQYQTICSRIRRKIRQCQIEGGMAGIYNPSITQRLNNLVERTDATTQGDKITNFELTLKI